MPTLKKEIKIYIVQQLAMFERPQEILTKVEETYGIKVNLSQVCYYDPKYDKISEDLKLIYTDTRERFIEKINEIPIANEAYRMQTLQNSLERQLKSRVVNEPLILDILEQAARERGGMFTNRREITGKGGKDLFDPISLARTVMNDLIAEGWNADEAMKFVVGRYKISETQLISDAVN